MCRHQLFLSMKCSLQRRKRCDWLILHQPNWKSDSSTTLSKQMISSLSTNLDCSQRETKTLELSSFEHLEKDQITTFTALSFQKTRSSFDWTEMPFEVEWHVREQWSTSQLTLLTEWWHPTLTFKYFQTQFSQMSQLSKQHSWNTRSCECSMQSLSQMANSLSYLSLQKRIRLISRQQSCQNLKTSTQHCRHASSSLLTTLRSLEWDWMTWLH